MFLALFLVAVTLPFVYLWYSRQKVNNFFEKRGIRHVKGHWYYGNAKGSMTATEHALHQFLRSYNAYPEDKYIGYSDLFSPVILVRDPELIKAITVKHFEHFIDHNDIFSTDGDIFSLSIFQMTGAVWKDMRTTLSPAFTGSKMRLLMPSMIEVSKNAIEYLRERTGQITDVDEAMRLYSNDVIASAGFGLEVNSFKDRNNDFHRVALGMREPGTLQIIGLILSMHIPFLTRFFNTGVFPEETVNFFRHIVTSTMEYREKNKVERPDMIQLLMESNKGNIKLEQSNDDNVGFAAGQEMLKPEGEKRKWSLDELASQVFFFYLAGLETVSTALVMTIHELALNPDIQDKLYQEIKKFSETKKLTFENIVDLKYLDCVINETLRLWTPDVNLDRRCVKTFDLPPPREGAKPVRLRPGDKVFNCMNGIHRDAKYFPNPDVYDPDRFSEENRHKINPSTFMPFGSGPRICLGSRFALLEMKVILYQLILNFKIVKCEKTLDPIKITAETLNMKVDGGTFVKFESRVE